MPRSVLLALVLAGALAGCSMGAPSAKRATAGEPAGGLTRGQAAAALRHAGMTMGNCPDGCWGRAVVNGVPVWTTTGAERGYSVRIVQERDAGRARELASVGVFASGSTQIDARCGRYVVIVLSRSGADPSRAVARTLTDALTCA